MSEKHTPTPWEHCGVNGRGETRILHREDDPVFLSERPGPNNPMSTTLVAHVMRDANAARIVTCVNGCEGIVNPSAIREVVERAEVICEWFADYEADCVKYGDFPEGEEIGEAHDLRSALASLKGESK